MVIAEGERPHLVLVVKENPARRLGDIIEQAHYDNGGEDGGTAEFIDRALSIFEAAFKPGADGKIIVENLEEGKRYVFDVTHKNIPFRRIQHKE